jgi:hypothetical protein
LSSLYTIFDLTRKILREAGPEVAHGPNSFGVIALNVLTEGIAPFTLWHQPLLDYEKKRSAEVGVLEHERAWEHYDQVVNQLMKLQEQMRIYADVLAQVSGAK